MRAITLTQPWAQLVAVRAKQIETRSWRTDYRGPLAIHAGAGLGPVGGERGLRRLCGEQPFFSALVDTVVHDAHTSLVDKIVQNLPRGAIVAVARLEMCLTTDPLVYDGFTGAFGDRLTDQERAFGDYSPGRYGWLLADVRRLAQPVPCKGALSLWQPSAEVLEAVKAQVQL